MRSTLYLKFIIIYIIFGFISLFSVATLSEELILQRLKQNASRSLHREVILIASTYLPRYFTGDISRSCIQLQFTTMSSYLGASVWFVEPDGTMIISSTVGGAFTPEQIYDFNPAEIGANLFMIGDYHGYFEENVITVMAPITQGLTIRGHLLIHRPVSTLVFLANQMMVYVYLSTLVVFLLSFIILLGFQFFIYLPLRKITEAATQYAAGNLEYEVPVGTHDEMGYLSASLNYMARQLRDMEDYQKKIISNISHDFRTPLTSIQGYVGAMTDGTISPDMHEKYLKIILSETERLTELTKDLLVLNEFSAKELLLSKTEFDIQRAIKQVVASFEGICTKRHLSIELLFLPDTVEVYADFGKIQQVLYNLIDNAIKFSDNNSSIIIEVLEKADKVFVSVKDYGEGIPRKELNKIWERFYKSDASRGRDKKGTGLGLAIVREALQAHDEYINVISTESVGTEFIFSLSKAKEEPDVYH